MFTLTDKIFGFFGVSAKLNDTYKDIDGKGIGERFNECLGEDYDENVASLIDDSLDKIAVPQTALSKFLVYLEYTAGMPIQLDVDDEGLRRKLLWLNHIITLTKGTLVSYKILLNLIGISGISVTNLINITGFDSGTFDDDDRRFDGRGGCCSHYELDLTGDPALDSDLEEKIKLIVYYLQPVDAELKSLTYNANPLSLP